MFETLNGLATQVLLFDNAVPLLKSAGTLSTLLLGLIFGLKHATEVDHVVAVSTIVSEHRKISRAALVGGLWGIGHTFSLLVVGALVLAMRVAVPHNVAEWLEFSVSIMIITLGSLALFRALKGRRDVHIHRHEHDGVAHAHIHFHEKESQHSGHVNKHSHDLKKIGVKPLIVGSVHGLAGSGVLTVAVLANIGSVALGLLYLFVFGFGSIIGMLLMSGLVGLPFTLSSRRLSGINNGLQLVAGVFSIAFGFWYAYQTGISTGLLKSIF
jgi:ABC-type nickel/cobalt efflux system permease component RcnA